MLGLKLNHVSKRGHCRRRPLHCGERVYSVASFPILCSFDFCIINSCPAVIRILTAYKMIKERWPVIAKITGHLCINWSDAKYYEQSWKTKYLGVANSKLSWKKHICLVAGNLSKSIATIIKAREYLNLSALLTLLILCVSLFNILQPCLGLHVLHQS